MTELDREIARPARRPSNLVVGLIVLAFILASGIIGLQGKLADYGRKSPPAATQVPAPQK
ncbi:MAG TPA: hypothetical protein VFL93_01515 [Longimicrobiaceae bacterium]|nr:hypothetical protein [Longimicrobiaceae bacterium]